MLVIQCSTRGNRRFLIAHGKLMSKSKFIFANCIRWSCVSFSNGVIDGAEKSPLDSSNAWESKTRGNFRPIAIGGVVSVGYLESCSILHVERKDKYKSTDLWQSPKWAVTNCFRSSCVALSHIDGADETAGSCTWKEKTSINQNTRGNLLNVFSQIPIGGLVSPC